jgi:hypothetical protein
MAVRMAAMEVPAEMTVGAEYQAYNSMVMESPARM